MLKPKAILLDLDDTLISFDGVSKQAWEKCCQDFLAAHPMPFSLPRLLDSLHKAQSWYWGDPKRHKTGRENIKEARRDVVRLALEPFGPFDTLLIHELADNYTAYHHSLIHLFPNTLDTLAALKEKGVRLGLITNGSSAAQREKLTRFGLVPFFEIILIDQEVGFSKPDVEIFEYALQLLNLFPQEVWMVGDNPVWDIQTPKAMGMHAIWYDAKKSGLPADTVILPDQVIQDISELALGLE